MPNYTILCFHNIFEEDLTTPQISLEDVLA